jgi:Asp-tRNA(Asn)/Glu-tRNA(Gln) amidotransferase A subunit family amidase
MKPPASQVVSAAAQIPFDVWETPIEQLQAAMAAGRVTSEALVGMYLSRIAAYDQQGPVLNTLIRLNPRAAAEAAALDQERKTKGPRGPLHGIPIVLKDNYDTQQLPTSAGSISLAGATPSRDGFITAKLRAAGAVLLGKTNLMEFAVGITTLSSLGGQTRNPYDPARYPGGSSGGTGAAVAASLAAVGWGTDTCGSIRVPSAFNSLVGLRPTKGITSVHGIVPLSATQDVAAPLARTVTDLAIALDVTVGLDSDDPAAAAWAARPLPHFVEALNANALRGARIGAVKEFFGSDTVELPVSAVVRSALTRMQEAGAKVVDISMPQLEAKALGASVIAFEFRDNLAAYLAYHPTAPVKSLSEILQRGLYLAELRDDFTLLNTSPGTNSPQYATAMANRAALQALLRQTLTANTLDALVYPTVRREPSLIGDPQTDPNCEPSANSGFPAMSVQAGFTPDGLPVGLELLGAPLSDAKLLAVGYAWEQLASPRQPPLYTPPLERRAAPRQVPIKVAIVADPVHADMDFSFDRVTGRLSYTVTITGLPADEMLAVSLHQPIDGATDGPVIAALAPPGRLTHAGQIALPVAARASLHQGQLYVSLLTKQHPRGALRGTLTPPPGSGERPPP